MTGRMIKPTVLLICLAAGLATGACGVSPESEAAGGGDGAVSVEAVDADAQAAIRRVLVDAYVSGIHVNRDAEAVRRGFHPDFVMSVYDEGQLQTVSLQTWLDHLQLDGVASSDTIDHVFLDIDVTGDAAIAVMEIHENGAHIYTDYFGLYRFPEGWRIVNKIFHGH